MDGLYLLIVVLCGQVALLLLDIRERYSTWSDRSSAGRLKLGSALFLVGTVLVYGGIQFGGLALVPNTNELLTTSQEFVHGFVRAVPAGSVQSNWALVWIGAAAFYFGGLCDYLFHRYISHSQPMWFTHEYHHLPTDISVYMPGICVRPFAVVAVFPVLAVSIFALQLGLGIAGFNGIDIMPFVSLAIFLQLSIAGMSHSAFLRRCWWAHRTLKPLGLTTPQEHWLHHVAELDGNYGNFTTIWDRIFGTYLDPEIIDHRQYRAGLDYDQDFLGAVTNSRLKLSGRLRRRFQLENFCYFESLVMSGDAEHCED